MKWQVTHWIKRESFLVKHTPTIFGKNKIKKKLWIKQFYWWKFGKILANFVLQKKNKQQVTETTISCKMYYIFGWKNDFLKLWIKQSIYEQISFAPHYYSFSGGNDILKFAVTK